MAERLRVGLVFSYNEKWIAGTYYILNIVHALQVLPDARKPILVILSDSKDTFNTLASETQYPYLEYVQYPYLDAKYNLLERLINKISRNILKKHVIVKFSKYPKMVMIYPKEIKGFPKYLKRVNWIPDFQEDYLPQFFTKQEVKRRKLNQRTVVATGDIAVFSSHDAKDDFIRLYPDAQAKPFVLPFAVTHPDFSSQDINKLLQRYHLPSHYFFVPNQFWAHKNHMVVLEALKLLKDTGVTPHIAMSGKENDYRNADNFKKLTTFVKTHGLDHQVHFLGFLPREEQLCLMQHSKAVIQPSLFEGWSTVVEDAKALNKYLIVSELKVHREQIQENCSFFDPRNPESLSSVLLAFLNNAPQVIPIDYKSHVKTFGETFLELVELAKP